MKKLLLSCLLVFSSIITAVASGHTVSVAPIAPINCFGLCNGSVTATVSGGVGPFTYSWSPSGGTGATAIGLCAGSYTATVTDNGDMSTATGTINLSEPTLLTASLPGSIMSCTGPSCVSLNPIVSGGTPTYNYNWTPLTGLTSSTIATPSACSLATSQSYTVTIADMNGCITTATTLVVANPTPTITLPPSYTACAGGCVGLLASATPGGASFVWSPVAGLSSIMIPNPVACPLTSGTYTVTAMLGGCNANAITVVYIDSITSSGITSTNTTGCATCDGTTTSTPTGGSSPYVYNWSTGATTPAVVSNCAGTYSVTITDAAGCTITDSTTIFANNDVVANFTMVPDSTNAYNFFAFNSSTGTGNSYDWSWGDGSPNSTIANPSHTFSAAGTMTVCLTASSFLCGADTLCKPVNVTGTPLSCLALFNIADDTLNPDPNAHYVYNLSFGSTLTYLWDFGDGTTSTSATPSHVYSGTGPYLLCLSVDNGAGCTDMFCDSLISADSLNRSSGIMQLMVYDVPPFQGLTTGVLDHMNEASVSVAPNPFSDVTVFEIKSSGSDVYSFELTDVLGKKVRSMNGITAKQFEISRNGLENGIYFYKIYSSESIIGVGKVIIK